MSVSPPPDSALDVDPPLDFSSELAELSTLHFFLTELAISPTLFLVEEFILHCFGNIIYRATISMFRSVKIMSCFPDIQT